jgi:hypothetical protein
VRTDERLVVTSERRESFHFFFMFKFGKAINTKEK